MSTEKKTFMTPGCHSVLPLIRARAGRPTLRPMTTTTTATERRRLTAIQAAWLYDGTGATLIENPTVVLDGTTIVSVGASAPAPEGATVIDLAGATLLPGLVDGHVHT